MDAEHRARMAAVFAWLEDSVRLAERHRLAGMLIFAQGGPRISRERCGARDRTGSRISATHCAIWRSGSQKPVLFVNGDTHLYKLDQPIADPATGRPVPNFTRVVVFGSPQTRWVRAGIDPKSPQLFRVSPAPQSAPRP